MRLYGGRLPHSSYNTQCLFCQYLIILYNKILYNNTNTTNSNIDTNKQTDILNIYLNLVTPQQALSVLPNV